MEISTDSSPIALTSLIKSLGYKNHTVLSNKVRDILKTKEDFDRFIVDDPSSNRRPERILVKQESRILVDNIAILLPYNTVFGKAKEGCNHQYIPYRTLISHERKSDFLEPFIKHKRKLNRHLILTQDSLNQLGPFAAAVQNNPSIDIKKDSLRDLINRCPNELPDLGNSYTTGIWDEIISLHEEIGNGNADSETFRYLGEKLYLIGEIDDAIDALEVSIEMDNKNGIAYVILALIYHYKLKISSKSLNQLYAQTDYSGSIAHPINAEEHWLNERMDIEEEQLSTIHLSFVKFATKGLYHWPQHDYRPHDGTKNYLPMLNTFRKSDIEVRRSSLFLKLAEHITAKEYADEQAMIDSIIESSLSIEEDSYYFITGLMTPSLQQEVNILALVNNYNSKLATAQLRKKARSVQEGPFLYSKGSLEFFKHPYVSHLYRCYVGQDSLYEVVDRLLKNQYEQGMIDNLSLRASWFYGECQPVLNKLSTLLKMYKIRPYDEFADLFASEPIKVSTVHAVSRNKQASFPEEVKEEIEEQMLLLKGKLKNWESFINEDVWLRHCNTQAEPYYIRTISLYGVLTDLALDKNSDCNLSVLLKLEEEAQGFRSCIAISDTSLELVQYLIDMINETCALKDHPALQHVLKRLIDETEVAEQVYFDQFE